MDNLKKTISKKIRDYIINETLMKKTKITNETLIFREGFFDSMGFIMMLTYIQETFGIKVNDVDMIEENFESINAIVEFINNKQNN